MLRKKEKKKTSEAQASLKTYCTLNLMLTEAAKKKGEKKGKGNNIYQYVISVEHCNKLSEFREISCESLLKCQSDISHQFGTRVPAALLNLSLFKNNLKQ